MSDTIAVIILTLGAEEQQYTFNRHTRVVKVLIEVSQRGGHPYYLLVPYIEAQATPVGLQNTLEYVYLRSAPSSNRQDETQTVTLTVLQHTMTIPKAVAEDERAAWTVLRALFRMRNGLSEEEVAEMKRELTRELTKAKDEMKKLLQAIQEATENERKQLQTKLREVQQHIAELKDPLSLKGCTLGNIMDLNGLPDLPIHNVVNLHDYLRALFPKLFRDFERACHLKPAKQIGYYPSSWPHESELLIDMQNVLKDCPRSHNSSRLLRHQVILKDDNYLLVPVALNRDPERTEPHGHFCQAVMRYGNTFRAFEPRLPEERLFQKHVGTLRPVDPPLLPALANDVGPLLGETSERLQEAQGCAQYYAHFHFTPEPGVPSALKDALQAVSEQAGVRTGGVRTPPVPRRL